MPLSRNLKMWIAPDVRLQQLCHLHPLNETVENKDYILTISNQSSISVHLHSLHLLIELILTTQEQLEDKSNTNS